jgi:hypothetical protein
VEPELLKKKQDVTNPQVDERHAQNCQSQESTDKGEAGLRRRSPMMHDSDQGLDTEQDGEDTVADLDDAGVDDVARPIRI